MTPPFVRKDMLPLAKELGCAPCAKHRHVEIDQSNWDELEALERRRNPNPNMKAVVNSVIAAWLGRK